jgi:hypothetical protein
MPDDHAERDAPQGALFAPESPASPPRPGPTPDPFAAPVRPSPEAAAAPEAEFAPSAARRRAAPLSGPTLDDVMSRVWEGLRAEVPTPCPVCHTEIESSMHGRCGACGSALD